MKIKPFAVLVLNVHQVANVRIGILLSFMLYLDQSFSNFGLKTPFKLRKMIEDSQKPLFMWVAFINIYR